MDKLKTIDIEIAIMQELGVRTNIIVPNIHWNLCLGGKLMHECDLLSLSKSNYATEIDIKISKADLLKDGEKKHSYSHDYIKYLYFAVPEILKEIALTEIPDRAGLYIIRNINNRNLVYKVKSSLPNKYVVKWSEKDRYELARLGTMRILGLKQKINNKQHNND